MLGCMVNCLNHQTREPVLERIVWWRLTNEGAFLRRQCELEQFVTFICLFYRALTHTLCKFLGPVYYEGKATPALTSA